MKGAGEQGAHRTPIPLHGLLSNHRGKGALTVGDSGRRPLATFLHLESLVTGHTTPRTSWCHTAGAPDLSVSVSSAPQDEALGSGVTPSNGPVQGPADPGGWPPPMTLSHVAPAGLLTVPLCPHCWPAQLCCLLGSPLRPLRPHSRSPRHSVLAATLSPACFLCAHHAGTGVQGALLVCSDHPS